MPMEVFNLIKDLQLLVVLLAIQEITQMLRSCGQEVQGGTFNNTRHF